MTEVDIAPLSPGSQVMRSMQRAGLTSRPAGKQGGAAAGRLCRSRRYGGGFPARAAGSVPLTRGLPLDAGSGAESPIAAVLLDGGYLDCPRRAYPDGSAPPVGPVCAYDQFAITVRDCEAAARAALATSEPGFGWQLPRLFRYSAGFASAKSTIKVRAETIAPLDGLLEPASAATEMGRHAAPRELTARGLGFVPPGRVLTGVMVTLGAIWLMFAAAVNWAHAGDELFYLFCGNTSRILHQEVWRLFTAPLTHMPSRTISQSCSPSSASSSSRRRSNSRWGGARMLRASSCCRA